MEQNQQEQNNRNSNDIQIELPKERVFYVFKEDKAIVLISNKDKTKFRTIDQLVAMSGYTDVTITKDKKHRGNFKYFLSSGEELNTCNTELGFMARLMISRWPVKSFYYISQLKEYAKALDRCNTIRKINEKYQKELKENNEKLLNF